jgi:DNA-binding LytR/AlgR family response regulator
MNKYPCIVVEDHKASRNLIEHYIDEKEEFILLNSCSSMKKAMDLIKNNPNAILFLDIVLKKENTIDFLEKNPIPNPIAFITGHKQFAHKAFDLDAYDYLLKPITKFQFDKCVNKLITRIELNQSSSKNKPYIVLSLNRVKTKVNLQTIIYIESDREYCLFHTETEILRSKISLKKVEEILQSHNFLKIHRSIIINRNFITRIYKDEIEIHNQRLPIGRSHKPIIRKLLI